MDRKEFKSYTSREIMITQNGKPTFAVCISSEGNNANYVYCKNGDVCFASSWCDSIQPFSLSNESHNIAKEMFTISIRASIKNKILELKQLQAILSDLHLEDCIGTLIQDNTRLLLEVKSAIEKDTIERKTERFTDKQEIQEIIEVATTNIKELPKKSEIKKAVEEAVIDTIQPMAVKKSKRSK